MILSYLCMTAPADGIATASNPIAPLLFLAGVLLTWLICRTVLRQRYIYFSPLMKLAVCIGGGVLLVVFILVLFAVINTYFMH